MKYHWIGIVAVLAMAATVYAADVDINGISWDPTPIQAGAPVTVYVHLFNRSSVASGPIALSIDWPAGFDLEKDYFGSGVPTINPNQAVVARYDLRVKPDTDEGHYRVKATLTEQNGSAREQSFFLEVTNNPQLQVDGASAISIQPGQSSKIDLRIKNIGHGQSQNIVVNFGSGQTVTATGVVVNPDVIPVGSSTQLIDSLDMGKEITVTFPVTASKSAALGVFSIPVHLMYESRSGTPFSATANVGLTIVSEPEVDGVLADAIPALVPGGTSKLTFNVFNVGSAAARYIVVDVQPFEGGRLSVDKIFVGTLEADDFDSFNVDLSVPADMVPGTKELSLQLAYKDDTGATQTKVIPIPINVADAKSAGGANGEMSPWLILLAIIVVLVLAYFAYRRLRPKRKSEGG